MRKKHLYATLGLFFCLSLISCEEQKTSSSSETLTDIVVTAAQTDMKVGDTSQINVAFVPTTVSFPLTYISSNPDVASVSSTGLVSALEAGNITITVNCENISKGIDFSISAKEDTYNAEEFGQALAATPYAQKYLTAGSYGLLDGGENVGVKESEFSEEKYPTISDDQANLVIDVNAMTLSDVQSVMPSITTLTDYYRIYAALLKAKNNSTGTTKIKLSGTYNCEGSLVTSWALFEADGMKNVYLVGSNDCTIVHQVSSFDWKSYFIFSNSENIHFNNITLKSDITASMTGFVTGSTDTSIALEIYPEFNALCDRLMANKIAIKSYFEFDSITNAPRDGGNNIVASSDGVINYSLNKSGDKYTCLITPPSAISRPAKGDFASLQFAQYDRNGMSFNTGKDLYVENVTMNDCPGMAFTADSINNVYVNRFALTRPEGSKAICTSCADGLHFNALSGVCTVTNSLIEYAQDDALNIKHGYWYKLADVSGVDKTIIASKITGTVKTPVAGDKIAVYDEESLVSHNPAIGYYTVASCSESAGRLSIVVNERISGASEWGSCRVTFLSNTVSFLFKNNIVQNKKNRGLLVQVPLAIIENNVFRNIGHGALSAHTSMDVFNEATIPNGLIVRNNKFINNCYSAPGALPGDISIFAISTNGTVGPAGTISNVTIENNFISHNSNAAIALRGVGSSSVKNCFFYNCSNSQPAGSLYNCLFYIYNGSGITIDSSYNEYHLDKGLSGIILQGLTTESDVKNTNNTAITFKKSEAGGTKYTVPKLTSAITIDGNLGDWNGAIAHDVVYDGFSYADGSATTAEAVSEHFAILTSKLAYDDTGLYLAFDIKDDLLDFKTPMDFWTGDCIEIIMSDIIAYPGADVQVYKEQGAIAQMAFAPTWPSYNDNIVWNTRTNSSVYDNRSMLKSVFTLTSAGYRGEIEIPFTMMPHLQSTILAGQPVDMAIVVADNDRGSVKRLQASNVPHFVEEYKTKTEKMPQYTFA